MRTRQTLVADPADRRHHRKSATFEYSTFRESQRPERIAFGFTAYAAGCFCMILEHEVQDFVAQLRRRQVEGSLDTAKRTAEILRLLLATQRHPTAQALLDDVRVVGSRLQAAKPAGMSMSPPVSEILFATGMEVCMHV